MFTYSTILTTPKLKRDRETAVLITEGLYKACKGVLFNVSVDRLIQHKLMGSIIAVDVSSSTDTYRRLIQVPVTFVQAYVPHVKIVTYKQELSTLASTGALVWSEQDIQIVRRRLQQMIQDQGPRTRIL